MSDFKKDKLSKLEKYKVLWEISEASPIIRRYFAMNFFDGVLTALGIVLAGFVTFIRNEYFGGAANPLVTNGTLFLTGITTAVAIGISGLTGSHLAESAERKLNVLQMKQVLGLLEEDEDKENQVSEEPKWSEKDLRLALGKFEKKGEIQKSHSLSKTMHLGLTPEQAKKLGLKIEKSEEGTKLVNKETGKETPIVFSKLSLSPHKKPEEKKSNNKDKEKTIFEEAQEFAGKVAAFIDGFSPFAGVMIVIIPFIFGDSSNPAILWQYVLSYGLSITVLFLLGRYLAKLSKESVLKYGLQMVGAAVLTSILSVLFSQITQNN